MRYMRFVVLGALLIAAVALGAAACGDDDEEKETERPAAGAAAAVDVTLGEWVVEADPASVSAGEVKFVVSNEGEEEHELVIFKTDLAPDALPTLDDGSVDEEGEGVELIGEIEDIAAGDSAELTVDLEAGRYVLLCNIGPGEHEMEHKAHYEEGMHAAFTVR